MCTTKKPRRKRCEDCNQLTLPTDMYDGKCETCDQEYFYCYHCEDRTDQDDARYDDDDDAFCLHKKDLYIEAL